MKGWLFLVIAIVGEVIATSALKSSEGFTKLAPSAVVIIGYGIAFYFLSLVLKSIPVGVAYAVWHLASQRLAFILKFAQPTELFPHRLRI